MFSQKVVTISDTSRLNSKSTFRNKETHLKGDTVFIGLRRQPPNKQKYKNDFLPVYPELRV